jgi:Ca2+-binding RTX toxin-like protein
VTGGTNGKLYALTVTATDSTLAVSSSAGALNVVIGGSGADTINLASMTGIVTSAPTFIYGLAGNDTINGAGMTGKLYIDGGAGADTMTGGSGGNVYEYASVSDSTPSAMDIIKNFNATMDVIDLTGLGVHLGTPAALASNATSIAADSIDWQTSSGNTFVYVNDAGSSEALSAANMKIELAGNIALTSSNIAHL